MTKRILVLSDIHVGSRFGLWHPDYESEKVNKVKLNPIQRQLWKYFNVMIEELRLIEPDLVILNGDLVDGANPRMAGYGLVTSNVDDQAACFERLYKMLPVKNPRKCYVTVGSDYHEIKYASVHRMIAENLTGDPDEYFLGEGKELHVGPYVIDVAHGSSKAFIYIEQMLGRIRMFMLSAAELFKASYADLIVRSHLHFFVEIKTMGRRVVKTRLGEPMVIPQRAIVTPGFQAQTDYMRKVERYKMLPDIGYVIIRLEKDDLKVDERLFRPLDIKDVRVVD